jgi:hypothetical protein
MKAYSLPKERAHGGTMTDLSDWMDEYSRPYVICM